jgi:Outer membrane protein and related peptidoglycan-associated (lipo)proteins
MKMSNRTIRHMAAMMGCALVFGMAALAVENPTRAIPSGEKQKISGIIQGRDGEALRVRTEDNSVVVVNLTDQTKVEMKKGLFHWSHKTMDVTSLVPGLRVEANGEGNAQGQLVASKVVFDPSSYKASRAIDTRVSPLEGRAGQLETKQGQLETKAGQLEAKAGELETKTGQLSDQQKQDEQVVGQVKSSADQANQGVSTVNNRVSTLDDYDQKYAATVYFKINSAKLSDDAMRDLDSLVQKSKELKGYMIEVAGFTDTTGNQALNEALSEKRADAVVRYLQMNDVPLRRILAPAGLGESHSVADNHTSSGRKLNRRVEVKVIVNKALEGPTSAMSQQNAQQAPAPAESH